VIPVSEADPATIHMTVDPVQASTLQIHITDEPGWSATIDGHPLSLRPLDGVMLEASVPPGRHAIVLTYFPGTFALGLAVAGAAFIALVAGMLFSWRRVARNNSLHGDDLTAVRLSPGSEAHPEGDD
jgi:uncharacterized membrane protein YfhO